MKSCSNCKRRFFKGWDGCWESCLWYEMAGTEEDMIETAKDCCKYEEGEPEGLNEPEYRPSATNRDYGPSNPWDAPGMSIHDFI